VEASPRGTLPKNTATHLNQKRKLLPYPPNQTLQTDPKIVAFRYRTGASTKTLNESQNFRKYARFSQLWQEKNYVGLTANSNHTNSCVGSKKEAV
jgi:hypothetical protein